MDKEELLVEFLKGLRIAINNSLAYTRQHPYFLKSSQEFKEKIDILLNLLNPIRVNVTPESIFLDDKDYNKLPFSAELAQILHQRKIKTIEFRPGESAEELADFLSLLAMHPKEILVNGGLSGMLKSVNVRYIRVEELDYSSLLGADGKEVKDVWLALFKEAVEKQDAQKVEELADNFSRAVNNPGLKKDIEKELSSLILNSSSQIKIDNEDKLKEALKDLDSEDFSNIMLSSFSDASSLNPLNFGLFCRLAGEERVDKLVASLADKVKNRLAMKNNPAMLKRIKDLLSGPDAESVSPTYRNALFSLIKGVSFKDRVFFDRRQLRSNYRNIILNFLEQEESREGLDLLLGRLNKEWPDIIRDADFGFFKELLGIIREIKKKGVLPPEPLERIEEGIGRTVEDSVWDEGEGADLSALIDSLGKCYNTSTFYLSKIFQERKAGAGGLKLFLRFFPDSLDNFCEQLRQRRADLEFLSQAIEGLSRISLPASLSALKAIFSFGNEFIRAQVLKAMGSVAGFDEEIAFGALREDSVMLRKEALSILAKDEAAKNRALEALLNIPSPWGSKNQFIIENIMIIEELGIQGTQDYLAILSKKRFFWNWRLRDKALEALRKSQ